MDRRGSNEVGRRTARRPWGAAAALAVVAVLWANPAGADPAKPTNYRSSVTDVEPASAVVAVSVVGGDGFLQMDVERGHTVEVEGYQGEPYLRVKADGTVEENTNSPATYLNQDRFASADVPPELDAEELPAPSWRQIGSDGLAVWHDHRIHFMGKDPSTIAGLAEGEPVPWTVAFTVDGTPTVASGSYQLKDAPSPILPLAWLILAVAAAGVLGRRSPVTGAAVAVLMAALVSLGIGFIGYTSIPAEAGPTVISVILPLVAVAAAGFGLWRRAQPAGVIGVLAAVAAEVGWFISRYTVMFKAELPTDLSPTVDRLGTAIVLGLALGAAAVAIRSGALAVPGIDEPPAAPAD